MQFKKFIFRSYFAHSDLKSSKALHPFFKAWTIDKSKSKEMEDDLRLLHSFFLAFLYLLNLSKAFVLITLTMLDLYRDTQARPVTSAVITLF